MHSPRPELLRAAKFRASRFGLDGELIDVHARRSIPAAGMIEPLRAFLRPALEDAGQWDEVSALVRQTIEGGNGAKRQRAAFARSGRFEDVVDRIVEETRRGLDRESVEEWEGTFDIPDSRCGRSLGLEGSSPSGIWNSSCGMDSFTASERADGRLSRREPPSSSRIP